MKFYKLLQKGVSQLKLMTENEVNLWKNCREQIKNTLQMEWNFILILPIEK